MNNNSKQSVISVIDYALNELSSVSRVNGMTELEVYQIFIIQLARNSKLSIEDVKEFVSIVKEYQLGV